jgi:hypothetical protein
MGSFHLKAGARDAHDFAELEKNGGASSGGNEKAL